MQLDPCRRRRAVATSARDVRRLLRLADRLDVGRVLVDLLRDGRLVRLVRQSARTAAERSTSIELRRARRSGRGGRPAAATSSRGGTSAGSQRRARRGASRWRGGSRLGPGGGREPESAREERRRDQARSASSAPRLHGLRPGEPEPRDGQSSYAGSASRARNHARAALACRPPSEPVHSPGAGGLLARFRGRGGCLAPGRERRAASRRAACTQGSSRYIPQAAAARRRRSRHADRPLHLLRPLLPRAARRRLGPPVPRHLPRDGRELRVHRDGERARARARHAPDGELPRSRSRGGPVRGPDLRGRAGRARPRRGGGGRGRRRDHRRQHGVPGEEGLRLRRGRRARARPAPRRGGGPRDPRGGAGAGHGQDPGGLGRRRR